MQPIPGKVLLGIVVATAGVKAVVKCTFPHARGSGKVTVLLEYNGLGAQFEEREKNEYWAGM